MQLKKIILTSVCFLLLLTVITACGTYKSDEKSKSPTSNNSSLLSSFDTTSSKPTVESDTQNTSTGEMTVSTEIDSSDDTYSDSSSLYSSSVEENSTESSSSSTSDNTTSSNTSSNNTPPEKPVVHMHSWSVSKVVSPTCTEQGYTLKSCSCGDTKRDSYTSASGHSFGSWITTKEPSKAQKGTAERSCSKCSHRETKSLDKLPQTATDIQLEVLRLVNAEREKEGLSPLKYYSQGQSAGDIRATEIETLFDHTRPDGTSCFTALDQLHIHYWAAGENIAMGHRTPEDVVTAWMNSPGHRANILNNDFTHIIIGYQNYCWVQLFLTPLE